MTCRINPYRCSRCGCDEPIHNAIDGKLYCNNCGMSLENSSVTNRNKTDSAVERVSDEWIEKAIDFLFAVYVDKNEKETFEAKIILALRELQERRKKRI